MIEGKIRLGFNGPLVDHRFCDICGWGDTVRASVKVEGWGTFDLCHRCNTPEKFAKRIKLFLKYNVLGQENKISFDRIKKIIAAV